MAAWEAALLQPGAASWLPDTLKSFQKQRIWQPELRFLALSHENKVTAVAC